MKHNSYNRKDRQIKEICKRYDKEVVRPLFGTGGEIRARLNEGLRMILEGLPFTFDRYLLTNTQKIDLDSNIDYRELTRVAGPRVANCLSAQNIKTYSELIRYHQTQILGLLGLRNFGPGSLDKLNSYLARKGIRLLPY